MKIEGIHCFLVVILIFLITIYGFFPIFSLLIAILYFIAFMFFFSMAIAQSKNRNEDEKE